MADRDPEAIKQDIDVARDQLAATADSLAELVRSSESLDLAWFDWDALPEPIAPDVARSMTAVRARLSQ